MKVWIFDLDDTLLDTSHWLIPLAAENSCKFLISEGVPASLEEMSHLREAWGVSIPHKELFTVLTRHFAPHFSEEKIIELGKKAADLFYHPRVPPHLPLMDDSEQVLSDFFEQKEFYLVTAGYQEIQETKVQALHIEKYFKQIFYVDTLHGETKFAAFEKIQKSEGCPFENILCIGNRLTQEIKEAKMLGIKTCYMAHGEHKGESPRRREEVPDWTVTNWKQFQEVRNQYDF